MRGLTVGIVVLLLLGLAACGHWNGKSAEAFTEQSPSFGSEDLDSDWGEWTGEIIEPRLTGRDFVQLGEVQMISGSLKYMDGEWFVQTDTELYEIHLGDHDHRVNIGIELKVEEEVFVYGFVYDDDVAVVSVLFPEYPHIPHASELSGYSPSRLEIVSGVLVNENGKWAIRTDIEMNNIDLSDNVSQMELDLSFFYEQEVTLHRFIYDNGTVSGSLSLTDHTYRFRTEEGRPLWAGGGRRDPADGGYGEGRGDFLGDGHGLGVYGY